MVNQPATSPTRVTGATPAPSLSHAPHDSLLQIVWRRKWIVVAAAIVALIGAFAYLSVTPKVYTSTSRILVQRVSSSLSAERGSSDADDTYLQTQCEVIKSTNVIAAALGTLDTRG